MYFCLLTKTPGYFCLLLSLSLTLQLTATLRNVADHPDSRPLFVSFSILSALCTVLRLHCKDQDICTNISRIYRYYSRTLVY